MDRDEILRVLLGTARVTGSSRPASTLAAFSSSVRSKRPRRPGASTGRGGRPLSD